MQHHISSDISDYLNVCSWDKNKNVHHTLLDMLDIELQKEYIPILFKRYVLNMLIICKNIQRYGLFSDHIIFGFKISILYLLLYYIYFCLEN